MSSREYPAERDTTRVDARCCRCKGVDIYTLKGHPEEWSEGSTFFQECRYCGEEEAPINVLALLHGSMSR